MINQVKIYNPVEVSSTYIDDVLTFSDFIFPDPSWHQREIKYLLQQFISDENIMNNGVNNTPVDYSIIEELGPTIYSIIEKICYSFPARGDLAKFKIV